MSPAPPYYRKPFDPEDPDQEQQGPPPVPPMRFNPPAPDGNIPNDSAAPAMPDSAPPPVRTPSPAAPVGPPVATAKAPSNIPPTFKQRILGGAPTSIMTPGINGAPPPVGGAPGAMTLPTPPPVRQPGLLQKIGSAGLGFAAGYTNAAGRAHIDPQTLAAAKEGILHPGQAQKQAEYEQQMERVKAQAGMAKTQADIGETNAKTGEAVSRGKLYDQQAKEAESNKRFITVADGTGIWDTQDKTWKVPPGNKTGLVELNPSIAREKFPILQPDVHGKFLVPAAVAGDAMKLSSSPEVKTIEEAVIGVINSKDVAEGDKRARIDELIKAHNMLHPQTPIHGIETDDAGNGTLVIADPSNPSAARRISLGKIGKSKTAPQGPQAMMVGPDGVAFVVKPGTAIPAGSQTTSGVNSSNTQTAATRTMGEAAPKVLDMAARVEALVDQQAASLGPAASRWSEFMAGKVGAPNPEFTKLRTDVSLLQTMLMRMHVGSRGGEQMMEHFRELIDLSKQSPENLKAALGEIRSYAQAVAHTAQPATSEAPKDPLGIR